MLPLDYLYQDTITLFNRRVVSGTYEWHATVLRGVHFIVQRGLIVATYGESSTDNAQLNVRYTKQGNEIVIQDKVYVMPMEWRRLSEDEIADHITFTGGEEFDFIYGGVWDGDKVVYDDEFDSGFFNYMNSNYDEVFAITNVSQFNFIPHFEITAK